MLTFVRTNELINQLKTDVDCYNDAHDEQEPIQMILDFTMDVQEIEVMEGFEDAA